MNFLAHLFVAETTPESRMGNILGDFVKGRPWDDRFETVIWKAIMEHRYVDAFTDAHPAWQKSRDLLDPGMRRYAGIVVDVFYDHFLCRKWSQFSPQIGLEEFIYSCYEDLNRGLPHAPASARSIIGQMISENWLGQYKSIEGIDYTLQRISQRAPFLEPMKNSVVELKNHFESMESHFEVFFPEAIAYVVKVREEMKTPQSI